MVENEVDLRSIIASNSPGAYGVGAVQPSFALNMLTTQLYRVGDVGNIAWTAGNVQTGDKVCLCYDADTTFWNGNETWIEIDQVAATDGSSSSFSWNTTGVRPGVYYVAGYLWTGGHPTISHLTRSITIAAH
jgi:hypothetical protein